MNFRILLKIKKFYGYWRVVSIFFVFAAFPVVTIRWATAPSSVIAAIATISPNVRCNTHQEAAIVFPRLISTPSRRFNTIWSVHCVWKNIAVLEYCKAIYIYIYIYILRNNEIILDLNKSNTTPFQILYTDKRNQQKPILFLLQ